MVLVSCEACQPSAAAAALSRRRPSAIAALWEPERHGWRWRLAALWAAWPASGFLAAAMAMLTGPRFPWGTLLINVVGLVRDRSGGGGHAFSPARIAMHPEPADLPDGRHLRRLHDLLGLPAYPDVPRTATIRAMPYAGGGIRCRVCRAVSRSGLELAGHSAEHNFAFSRAARIRHKPRVSPRSRDRGRLLHGSKDA